MKDKSNIYVYEKQMGQGTKSLVDVSILFLSALRSVGEGIPQQQLDFSNA